MKNFKFPNPIVVFFDFRIYVKVISAGKSNTIDRHLAQSNNLLVLIKNCSADFIIMFSKVVYNVKSLQ